MWILPHVVEISRHNATEKLEFFATDRLQYIAFVIGVVEEHATFTFADVAAGNVSKTIAKGLQIDAERLTQLLETYRGVILKLEHLAVSVQIVVEHFLCCVRLSFALAWRPYWSIQTNGDALHDQRTNVRQISRF